MAKLEKGLAERRDTFTRRVLYLLIVLLTLAAVGLGAFLFFVDGTGFSKLNRNSDSVLAGTGKINILVLGVDERSDDVGRSDTMFVLTIDPAKKSVAMLSVPRDTRVQIPGRGWDKINHAYAFGGYKLSKQSVEGLLGIPMDYYVTVNFSGFIKIIDAIGGVDVDVEKRMYYNDPYDDNGGLHIDLRPGMQHMDGRTAIEYVRYRDEEGDIGRISRQQHFLKALLSRVSSPAIITKIPGVIGELSSVLKTDMSTTEMLNLAKLLNDASKQGLKVDMVPGKPAYIDDISYWLPDILDLRTHVAQTLGIQPDSRYFASAHQAAGDYERSVPKEMKILEPPKHAESVNKNPTDAEKSKADGKTDQDTRTHHEPKQAPAKMTIAVVNASGVSSVGGKVASILRRQGFDVVSVSSSGVTSSTVVTAHTQDRDVVLKLNSLPFSYVLQADQDGGGGASATVVVGKDYVEMPLPKENAKE